MSTSGFLSKPYTVRLEKLISNGCSLAHVDGMAVFVPYGIPGEEVQIEITESKKGYLMGRIMGIMDSSPDRVIPPCRLFGRCGGCTLQHIGYSKQLELKQEMLAEALARTGHIEAPPVTVHPSEPYGYRVRVQLHPAKGGGAGFMASGTSTVLSASSCNTCCPGLNRLLADGVEIKERTTFFAPDGQQVFCAAAGNQTLDITVKGKVLKASPQCFFQSNRAMFEKMLSVLDGMVTGGGTYLDLYSGIGVPGIFFQDRFQQLIFVEESPVSARYGALNTGAYPNCRFFNMRCEDWAASKRRCRSADTVFVDPPRTGLSSAVRQYLIKLKTKKLFYLSCSFVTLARDLGELVRSGYRIESFDMFDFYPQTADMECLVGVSYGS
jgi:23S rRNA (uracil1939-C5)-methyltransferase